MSAAPLVIVGAGGFGREVIAIVEAINHEGPRWQLLGAADDQPTAAALDSLAGSATKYLGATEEAIARAGPGASVVVAIGDPQLRADAIRRLPRSTPFATLVHPDATVGSRVALGPGCVLSPGVRLSTDIALDAHVHVDQNVTVGHDTRIGAFSRLNPQCCVSGGVALGASTYVGSNATILQNLSLGTGAVVGAGAVVVRDVPPGVTVKGVPAR